VVIVTARHFLSLVRTVFFRAFGFYTTGSINLYVYVCLILISLHVIELCLCPYLPSLAPVCDCVCHLALSRYELFIRVYCSYSNNYVFIGTT
jgi:hypothetical protein